MAETSQADGIHRLIRRFVDPPADAVAVGVVGIRDGMHVVHRHGLQQAEADELGRDTGRKADARREIAVAQVAHLVDGFAQLECAAVGVAAADGLVVDGGKALADGRVRSAAEGRKPGGDSAAAVEGREAEGLQQRSVVGVGDGFAVGVGAEA